MDIFKNLPNELQEIIYNDYLQKQRQYHIDRFNKNTKLNNNVNYFNNFINELLTYYHYHELIDDESNAFINGALLPFDSRDLIRNIKQYQEVEED